MWYLCYIALYKTRVAGARARAGKSPGLHGASPAMQRAARLAEITATPAARAGGQAPPRHSNVCRSDLHMFRRWREDSHNI